MEIFTAIAMLCSSENFRSDVKLCQIKMMDCVDKHTKTTDSSDVTVKIVKECYKSSVFIPQENKWKTKN